MQELNVKIDHIESYESPDSNNRYYSIHVECDCRNEETKAELEERLKACTGTLDDIEFLLISEAHKGTITVYYACVCATEQLLY